MTKAIPGLGLAAVIALLALGVTRWLAIPGSNALVVAIFMGILFRILVGVPDGARPGLSIAMTHALRLGVALIGVQLSLGQVLAIGWRGVVVAVIALIATFQFTRWLGRLMALEARLVALLAVGTSICGASAIVGANAIARASREDVSYAVTAVTIMGLILMTLYPHAANWLQMSAPDYGIWVGASIHEVAQVVAAGFQLGPAAGQIATVVKLTRVLMLAPSLLLAWSATRQLEGNGGPRVSVPWFVIAFVVAAIANSLGAIPDRCRDLLAAGVPVILAIGMAAVGIDTNARELIKRGARPLLLAFAATLFIALLSLALIVASSAAM